MLNRYITTGLILLSALVLALGAPTGAWAQTGPGGVGTTDGGSNLRIWLQADEGVNPTDGTPITEWSNQAGTGNPSTSGDPTFQSGVVEGKPVVRFDGTDDQFQFSSLNGIPNGENTLLVVSANAGSGNFNQAIVGFGPIGSSGAPDARGLLYNLDNQTASVDIVLAGISGDAKGSSQNKLETGAKAVSTSYNTTPFSVYSSLVSDSADTGNGQNAITHRQELLANGEVLDTGAASILSGTPRVGERVIGDIAEVIAIDRKLNAAERTIVHNYLSTKYGISLTGAVSDVYQWDGGYGGDVVGVGNEASSIGKAPGGEKTISQSSGLRLEVGGALSNLDYVLYGHDDANFAFTAIEPPNDRDNVEKLAREWRIDMTDLPSLTGVTMGFDETQLATGEQLSGNSYNDYFLYVDDDGDFSDGDATAYDLEDGDNDGTYTNSNVDISDGDYVTIAHIKRQFRFASSLDSEFENIAGTVSVTAEINFKNSTTLSVPYSVANGTPSPTQGADYTVSSGSFDFSAGQTTNVRSPFDVVDDSESEPDTEFIEVTPGTLPDNVSAGTPSLFEFGILDEDNAREIAFDSGNPSSVQEGNLGTKTQTFTVTLRNGETGPASATYRIQGTATAGEDYEIVGASTTDTTRGTVNIGSSSSTGSFKIDILGDEIDEGDETLEIELFAAQNATLDSGGPLQETFTISDDDPTPEVNFTSGSYSGEEGTDVDVIVELTQPAGRDLDVTVADDGSGDATEGSDYTFSSPKTVTIAAGKTKGTVSIPLSNDGTVEATETIDISIPDAGTDPPLGTTTTAIVSILDNSGIGNTGPGGVGDATTLSLWLRPDDGVTTSNGVSEWLDQSGNGNDATQTNSGERPAFGTATRNGLNLVTFDGTDDFLRSNVASLPSSSNTLFAVSEANAVSTVFGVDDDGFISLRTLEYTSNASTAAASQDGSTTGGVGGAGGVAVLSSAFDGSDVGIRVDGGAETSTTAGTNSNGTYAILGGEPGNGGSSQDPDLVSDNAFDGDVGDVIAYNTPLNTAQRLIVTNYLASKYAVTSLSTDLYDGDLGADGNNGTADDRDTDVLGVGQASDGTKHFSARGAGLGLTVAGNVDNGEFVLAGRKIGVEQRINVSDTSTSSDNVDLDARLNDDRYLDITGAVNVDITFDFGNFGVVGPAGNVSNYVLLRRSGTSGAWTRVATDGISAAGDRVTFANVPLGDANDGYYTIGTTSSVESPLDARFLTITGESGAASAGGNGADAGYFDIGLPITGGTPGSLVRPDGTPFFTSTTLGLNGLSSNTGILYTWDYSSQSYVQVTGTDESLPNGRGVTLWVKDDANFPVDPELNFGLKDVSNEPTTNQTETVPDKSGQYVYLANPYLSAYDMSAFTDLDQNGFQSTIELWDKDAGGAYGSYVTKTQGTNDDNIGRYQSFFIERSTVGSGAETFTFDRTGRLNQNVPLIGAKTRATEKTNEPQLAYRRIGLELTALNDRGAEIAGDIAANILFQGDADSGWDAYDSPKYQPPSTTYATIAPLGSGRDGSLTAKSQESRDYRPGGTLEIPLAFHSKNLEGPFTLSARKIENIPDSWEATLIDTKRTSDAGDDARYDLSRSAEPYRFRLASAGRDDARLVSEDDMGLPRMPATLNLAPEADDAQPRFLLRVEPAKSTLPVELSNLTASTDGQDAILKWTTATETNNLNFTIEKKTKTGYERVAQVEAAGTSTQPQPYQHRINALDYGRHTFRLSQTDADGSTVALNTVNVKVNLNEAYSFSKPAPNPFRRRTTLDLAVQTSQEVTVEVFNVLGQHVRTLYDGTLEANSTRTLRLDGRDLASGLYFVRVRGEDFVAHRRAMLVQ